MRNDDLGSRSQEQYVGTVKFFNKQKGFGFLTFSKGDVFVHMSKIEGAEYLEKGQEVEFKVLESYKGKQACEVRIIKGGK